MRAGKSWTDYPTERGAQALEHFTHRYRSQPPEQMGDVKETIANFLQCISDSRHRRRVLFVTPTRSVLTKSTVAKSSVLRCRKYPDRTPVNEHLPEMLFYTHVFAPVR
jgi:hypothetical protein